MEGLEIGCFVVCISGIKSEFKTRDEVEQDIGIVVDYVFDVELCEILVEVDWGESGKTKHLPETLEMVEVVDALIH